MPVIAVINRKGGSGKSTMATHLAAWLASQGASVMLGDVDRQQSTRTWLKRRNPQLPAISAWAIDQKNVLKVPVGVTHVVLDTPGGLHGFELAKVVMSANAILVPVCHSMFDRESAAACIAELHALPRLASGRCKLGVVGMRIDARTHAALTLRAWAASVPVPFLGVLRETQSYVRSLDSGQTIFDVQGATSKPDLDQWEPILRWLQPITGLPAIPMDTSSNENVDLAISQRMPPKPAANEPLGPAVGGERIAATRAASLMPAQESLVHGSRLSVFSSGHGGTATESPAVKPARELQGLDTPRFLLRQ